ncbi:MAG: response regulator, partial [Pseudomonadales bacterium]|nr:response regulator [Pseudomonadales bacterium]
GIAHDFNNLLTPILGYTSMLMETSLPADVHDKLRAMENAASRARDVVQQILTFSRQQQAIPVRTPIDISQVITEAVSLMQASIPSSVRIVKELEETGAVVVDPNQLHQVVVNLCTNAAQAIDAASGLITVRLYQIEPGSPLIPAHIAPAAFACIEVTDSGRGMSREVIGHIFEPFFTTKKVGEGSGLGLSVVHGIVTTYGGEITVESEERRGTTFRVLLPLALQPVDAAVRGVRVLLVDDEQAVLRVTGELLTTQGFEVESFTNPRMALEAFSRAPAEFDVLLTDHNMPEMTGSELARQIRAVRPDLPIILITGFASSSEDELGGIDHKIMKPVSGRELSMVIQQSLALRHHPG